MTSNKQDSGGWAILGLGCIGSLWASRFMNNDIPIELLLSNKARLEALKSRGLTVYQNTGSTTYRPQQLSTRETDRETIKHLLITTKAQQTLLALDAFSHRINTKTRLIVLQNGMGVAEEIQRKMPLNPLFLGITTEGAYRTDSCTVVHAGEGETWIGPAQKNQQFTQFSLLQNINQRCFWENNIHPRLWQKFAINCAINGLTVLFECKNGELLQIKEAYKKMADICGEIETVLSKKGISLAEPLLKTTTHIAQRTANNYSSMLQDFRAQRDLELKYLNIYLCEEAQRLHLDTPHNQALLKEINLLT
ncbi:MAG: 2-dehydropantoate 2-reductase [Pseudomonadales bacterium]|nr:2-dehydropantoate 2-reductase [Pseudomonadales bacterium]